MLWGDILMWLIILFIIPGSAIVGLFTKQEGKEPYVWIYSFIISILMYALVGWVIW